MSTIDKTPPAVESGEVIAWPTPRQLIEAQRGPVLPQRGPLSVVGLRVDGLTIAAVLELDKGRLDRWRYCAVSELPAEGGGLGPDRSRDTGVVRVWLDGWGGQGPRHVDLEVKPLRGDRWKFRNADIHGVFDEHPIAGCHLEVTFYQGFLASNDVASGVCEAYVRAVAATLGAVSELRVRRLDLAADVAGWAIRPGDRDLWIKPGRSPVTSYVDLPEAENVREHGQGTRITGYTVGAGGPILLRVYDKRTHLAEREPDKREGEELLWKSRGWSGEGPVTRVEFQLRTEALRSFGVEGPEGLARALDPLWQNLTHRWCRLALLDNKRPDRRTLDPRWALLREVRFSHLSLPAARRYFSSGASARQALGNVISYLARQGGEGLAFVLPGPQEPEDRARERLEMMVMRAMTFASKSLCDELARILGTYHAAIEYVSASAANRLARASTVGGGAVPPEQEAPRERKKRPSVQLWVAA